MNKTQLQAIDFTELMKLQEISKMGNPHLINQLIDMFLKEAPENFETLKTAVANGDLNEVQKTAHALKSTCASLGIFKMKDLCSKLENSEILNDGPAAIQELEKAFKVASQELSEIRSKGSYSE